MDREELAEKIQFLSSDDKEDIMDYFENRSDCVVI